MPTYRGGDLANAQESPTRSFGHRVAQRTTELGAIALALFAQFLETFGVGSQGLNRIRGCGLHTSA